MDLRDPSPIPSLNYYCFEARRSNIKPLCIFIPEYKEFNNEPLWQALQNCNDKKEKLEKNIFSSTQYIHDQGFQYPHFPKKKKIIIRQTLPINETCMISRSILTGNSDPVLQGSLIFSSLPCLKLNPKEF